MAFLKQKISKSFNTTLCSRAKIAGFSTNEYVTMNKERRELDWNRDYFPKPGDDLTSVFECLADDIARKHTF